MKNNDKYAWMDVAECRGSDPALFFPGKGMNREMFMAIAICERCPVKDPCLKEAMDLGAEKAMGIWGGTTERGRRELRKQRRIAS